MEAFEYFAPTRVLFGEHQEEQLPALLKRAQAHKVLIHYGGESAVKSGLLDKIIALLQKAELPYITLGGVIANPVLSKVREGIALCKQEQVDFILAVGGGSVIDSSKAIAYGVVHDGDIWDYYIRKKTIQGSLKVGCVLTIAAAGSEMSNSSVITNEDGGIKRGLSTEYGYCIFAIMNPQNTLTLPAYQSMSGAVDIMMHTLERYFHNEKPMEIFDHIAMGVLKTVLHHAPRVLADSADLESRRELLWAGSVSHNGMSGPREPGDWACHQLEHELSGMFGVAHGAGLSAIWASWARYVMDANLTRFASLARELFDIRIEDDYEAANAGIDQMEIFFQHIQMPVNLHQLGLNLSEEQLQELSEKCSFYQTRTIGCVKQLNNADMYNIYQMANR